MRSAARCWRSPMLAAALLTLPLAFTNDHQGQPAPSRDVMPTCFAPGPVLWREAGGQSLVCAPTPTATATRPGGACWRIYLHPVTFVEGTGGSIEARFALADGASAGTLPVEAIPDHQTFVVEARLGSDEATSTRAVSCHLASTLHFYCPATRTLDRLCLTWDGPNHGDGRGRGPKG
jgi:hypothetical protein